MGIEIALYHHERWDGCGYPDGLSGLNIPLSARIMALADVYDALCSDRCYRKALEHEHVMEMITRESGRQFDAEIVAAFLALESNFQQIRNLNK
jgi:putative two-component system response regulator